ncbi:hypothetical protein HN587_07905 [Candidatus Woesearchaeota archaeon]|jgi:hypothetical protein|nr:hypothetical protein [Candidatus Woesearchaeota archaeon]
MISNLSTIQIIGLSVAVFLLLWALIVFHSRRKTHSLTGTAKHEAAAKKRDIHAEDTLAHETIKRLRNGSNPFSTDQIRFIVTEGETVLAHLKEEVRVLLAITQDLCPWSNKNAYVVADKKTKRITYIKQGRRQDVEESIQALHDKAKTTNSSKLYKRLETYKSKMLQLEQRLLTNHLPGNYKFSDYTKNSKLWKSNEVLGKILYGTGVLATIIHEAHSGDPHGQKNAYKFITEMELDLKELADAIDAHSKHFLSHLKKELK